MAKKTTSKKTDIERYPKMFVDIETVGDEQAIKLLDRPSAPKNIKDPDKIEAAIQEKLAETIELAPLNNDIGKIAAIGYAIGRDGEIVTDLVTKKNTEKKVLENFWQAFATVNGRCAGYNILGFDLPFIMKRSFALNIRPSIIPSLIKYRIEPVTDLFMILSNWDYHNGRKFKWVCKRYGIEILEEGVDGSMVKDMTQEELAKYLYSDVHATRELYYRMEGYYFV